MTETRSATGLRAGIWLAWLPLPVFVVAIAVANAIDSDAVYGRPGTLLLFNFLFATVSALVVAFLIGRSFLLRHEPSLLLLGSGVLMWGLAGLVSSITGGRDINENVTVHNVALLISSVSCLSGAIVSLIPRGRMREPAKWLVTVYAATLVVLVGIAIATTNDLLPIFFIQGTGGTPVRQAVLGSAIALFVLTAIVLRAGKGGTISPFVQWYTLGLLLFATGLFGVLIQVRFGSVLGWISRAAQYSGGVYILVAALVSVRDARIWGISLEESLHEARQRYDELFEVAADGILVIRLQAQTGETIERANPAACELLGYPAEQMAGSNLADLVAPDQRSQLASALQGMKSAGLLRLETTLVAKDGRRIAADIHMRVFEERGKPMVMAMIRDITEHRRADEQVRELSQRLTYHVDNSPLAVIEWGPDMRVTRWSKEAERLFGWTAAEVLGKRTQDFRWVHDEDVPSVARVGIALSKGGNKFSANRNYRKDGSVVHCEWYNSSLADETGQMRSILSLVLDVTARKEAEAKLEEAKRLLDALMEHVPEGITIVRAADLQVQLVSRYGQELLGMVRTGVPAADAVPGMQLYAADGVTPLKFEDRPITRAILRGEIVRDMEVLSALPDGSRFPLLCNAAPIRDASGAIVGGVTAWRDLTERKRAEERLLHAQKLESIGLLAGGIAHDFNNLLVGVIGNASLALEMLGPRDPAAELLEQVIKSGEHASHLTRQMLAYSGKGRFVFEAVDVSKVVAQIADLVRPSIPKKVTVQLDLAPNLPPIKADPGQIQQVVMNLLINGGEAIGDRIGLLSARTRVVEFAAGQDFGDFQGFEPEPGYYVSIEVRDTGAGMDEATRSRIFDPFFTTKFTGRGLGLAAVSGILRGHKGAIRVESEPGKGTCFEVLFPVQCPSEAPPPAEPPAAVREPGRTDATVLVVDDEDLVRELSARALQAAGFRVHAAASGAEAAAILSREGDAITLVLLDLSMPDMDGVETLELLRQTHPSVHAMITSGFSEQETMRLFQGLRVSGFVQKPYTARMLVNAVRSCLPARPQ